MSEEPFYSPNHKPLPPRQAQRGELLFEFLYGHDQYRFELRDHGKYGVEAEFFLNEEFFYGRRFDASVDPVRTARDVAVQWAEEERKALAKGDA